MEGSRARHQHASVFAREGVGLRLYCTPHFESHVSISVSLHAWHTTQHDRHDRAAHQFNNCELLCCSAIIIFPCRHVALGTASATQPSIMANRAHHRQPSAALQAQAFRLFAQSFSGRPSSEWLLDPTAARDDSRAESHCCDSSSVYRDLGPALLALLRTVTSNHPQTSIHARHQSQRSVCAKWAKLVGAQP